MKFFKIPSIYAIGLSNFFKHYSSSSSSSKELISVYVLDPFLLMDPFKDEAKTMVPIRVNPNFVPLFDKGEFELGEFDDPMNSWYFGKKAEIFQYKFLGSHKVVSGWSGIICESVLQEWKKGKEVIPRLNLQQFNKHLDEIQNFQNTPLIFAGRVVDCSQASVYKLGSNGETSGIMIQSDFEYEED
eukprot:TRINITY_DN9971_c0_g1_i1.p1 TRINITY_DN9971_c0_g1~~TRINITY_DN9971_c0_g1_i1.p1  ORF type:complete len:186 (-),score=19.90 TRINITY_DN9971_c0_g1_i1:127-684(-)